jgi:ABC-type transport system involved in multi-copper enzyme maturation permease subunit
MSKGTLDQQTGTQGGARRAADVTPAETPSRTAEAQPTVARTVGMVGACFILFGLAMHFCNTHVESPRFKFNPTVVRLWWVLGVAGLVVHAVRDRDELFRRLYGTLGYALLAFGAVATCFSVTTTWVDSTTAGVAAGVLGLLALMAAAAPFVRDDPAVTAPAGDTALQRLGRFFPRWWQGLATSKAVQLATLGVAVIIAGSWVVGSVLLQRLNLMPYGLGAMGLGLLFLWPYATNEPDERWRDAAVSLLGVVGGAAALVGLSSVLTDWLNLEEILFPYGLVFSLLGLVLLTIDITLAGADSDRGYRVAAAVGVAGLAVLVLALARSIVPALAFPTPSLRVPAGFLLSVVGAAYALVGAATVSDNRLLIMTRRELAAFFYSPVAYIVIAGMVLVSWASFLLFLARLEPQGFAGQAPPVPEPIIRYYFFAIVPVIALVFAVPVVTMRLLSEEQRTGTMEVLLTAPVGETSIVLSKFFAALVFFMVTWLSWAAFPVLLRVIGGESFDYRPLLSFYVGMAFMSANFLGMGLFCSSLTRNQIIAAILTFAGMIAQTVPAFVMWMVMDAGGSETTLRVLRFFSYLHHMDELVEGKVHLHYLAFHLSLAIFWVFLTVKVLEARKWR